MTRFLAVVLVVVVGTLPLAGCKKKPDGGGGSDAPAGGGASSGGVRLKPVERINGLPISIQVPKGWVSEVLEGPEALERQGPPPGLVDLTENSEMWRAGRPSPTGRVDPFVTISVDPRLPKGTTALKYLETIRAEQTKTGLKIRHLDTERIERDGRQGYSVRDAMEVPTGVGGATPVLQVARLFVDGPLGITVTGMMLQDDKTEVDVEMRAIMESITFTQPVPKEPGAGP